MGVMLPDQLDESGGRESVWARLNISGMVRLTCLQIRRTLRRARASAAIPEVKGNQAGLMRIYYPRITHNI